MFRSIDSYKTDPDANSFRRRMQGLSAAELDRDLVDLCADVEFLESQIECDLGSYSPSELVTAHEKVSKFKIRREILKMELENRQRRGKVA